MMAVHTVGTDSQGLGEPGAQRDGAAVSRANTITVTGAATVSLAPDEAMLTFVVESDGVEPGSSMTANATAVGSLLARLSAEGVGGGATQTAHVSVYPIRIYDPKTGQESLTGYRSQNTVVVRLRGADMPDAAGRLLSAGLESGATGVSGPAWRLHDETPAVAEALRRAALNARMKADALAEAQKMRVGEVVAIREGAASLATSAGARDVGYAKMAAMSVPDLPVSVGTLDITATVTVTYTLDR